MKSPKDRKSKLSERMVKLKEGCPQMGFIICVIKYLFSTI